MSTCLAAGARAQQLDLCGDLANGYGPFDYRSDRGETLGRVDRAHFPPITEALIRGKAERSQPGPDIDYTLRAYPNHHRALAATIRFGVRTKRDPPPGMRYTVECWLLRATRFRPDDTVVRGLYAKYLLENKRKPEALAQLRAAESFAGDNPFSHYNIGLLYLEAQEYDAALLQAHRALAMGFPRTELRAGLAAAGRWRDPVDAAATPASAASQPLAATASDTVATPALKP